MAGPDSPDCEELPGPGDSREPGPFFDTKTIIDLEVFPHESYTFLQVADRAPVHILPRLKALPNVKALVLRRTEGTLRDVGCPAALLEALPSMTSLEEVGWDKNPSAPELEVMQRLPNLRSLELRSPHAWQVSEVNALAKLMGLTRLRGDFWDTDVTPLLQLTLLVDLEVRGASVPRSLLFRVLTQFPCLDTLAWDVNYTPSLDVEDTFRPVRPGIAGQLSWLECTPLDSQARDALQSVAFPVLQYFKGEEDRFPDEEGADMDHSLAWFPRMCASAPGLMYLHLFLCPTQDQHRPLNVGDGIARLTRLEGLLLSCEAPDVTESCPRSYLGAQVLAGLTRLTRVWVEGVVDPRFFDREVRALSGLKNLRELSLCEATGYFAAEHDRSREDGIITREAVASLLAGLPNLRRFTVRGAWVDLSRPGWAGTRVTPSGHLVVESIPLRDDRHLEEEGDVLVDKTMFL